MFHFFFICAFPLEKSVGKIYGQNKGFRKKEVAFVALLQIFSASCSLVVLVFAVFLEI